jgi:cell growth-regulating nucleolar protein
VPRQAYVEDAPDAEGGALALVDAPPHAPSPPPSSRALPEVNVFDFLVNEETPNASRVSIPPAEKPRAIEARKPSPVPEPAGQMDVQYHGPEHPPYRDYDPHRDYYEHGFAYGAAPVPPAFERYDSYAAMPPTGPVYDYPPPAYQTPAPKYYRHERRPSFDQDTDINTTSKKKSERKRKRQQLEDLDLSMVRDEIMTDAPPTLHSGLTAGVNRLLSRPEFPPSPDYSGNDHLDASPLSPLKRSKHAPRPDEELRERDRLRERGRERQRKTSGAPSTVARTEGGRSRRSRRERDDTEKPRRRDRERRRRRRRSSSAESQERGYEASRDVRHRRPLKAIEYHRGDSADATGRELVLHGATSAPDAGSANRADFFSSFVTKGPDSERGYSFNKALKRYHRERELNGLSKAEEEKELWKCLRLRRNDRGEMVLFF